MKIIETSVAGVVVIEPEVYYDARGYFMESYSQRDFDAALRPVRFVQDNESRSRRGVVRGLHFQLPPFAQSKLVRVSEGAVRDIVVDIRRGSPSFGRYAAVELSAENRRQLFIPRGFAHGFVALSDEAVVQYKCDNRYAPERSAAIAWNDPELNIDWGVRDCDAVLSPKDEAAPRLADAGELFDYATDYYL